MHAGYMRIICQPICLNLGLYIAVKYCRAMLLWCRSRRQMMMGMVSLGISVDCFFAAVEVAILKFALVKPNVLFAYGDLVPLQRSDYLVYVSLWRIKNSWEELL